MPTTIHVEEMVSKSERKESEDARGLKNDIQT